MKATYKSYPSNLTAEQWIFISPYLPVAKSGGRPRSTNLQAVLNAIFYVLCSGCPWRMLPGDFPAWQTVYSYFRRWHTRFTCPESSILGATELLDGTWIRIHRYLREWVRLGQNRHGSPSVAIVDSQSVEVGILTNNSVGYDGGKKVKGRKRHLLVDTMGLVLIVVVTAGNISDQAGAKVLFQKLKSCKRSPVAIIFNLYRRYLSR